MINDAICHEQQLTNSYTRKPNKRTNKNNIHNFVFDVCWNGVSFVDIFLLCLSASLLYSYIVHVICVLMPLISVYLIENILKCTCFTFCVFFFFHLVVVVKNCFVSFFILYENWKSNRITWSVLCLIFVFVCAVKYETPIFISIIIDYFWINDTFSVLPRISCIK